MLNIIKPDFFLESFNCVTANFIEENKIQLIISDLDGTLASENELGDSTFLKWLDNMRSLNVEIIIASNNKKGRVELFSNQTKLESYANCVKPFSKKIKRVYKEKGIAAENILFLGDQIFTDVMCGKSLGVKTAIVKPIPGRETWKTKIKRRPEKFLFRRWGQGI